MLRLLIIAPQSRVLAELKSELNQDGFVCSIIPHGNNGLVEKMTAYRPDLIMVEVDGYSSSAGIQELAHRIKEESSTPIIALVARDKLDGIDVHRGVDDFLISPYDIKELILRINRLLHRNGNTNSNELIKCDGLVIDLAKCEVIVDGRIVELTFKEYELLKFLAGNRGRVYTRDTLLDKVWGYDYYGGDRTVDVHVRRLRSKIEDSKHTFIDTVRNIGYRFRMETR
jgi:two-component system alkaline phosphatase synthesis response regulator PhoP